MAEDAGAAEGAVVGVVVLDGVEDDGEAGVFAADGNGRFDAVEGAGKLDIHEDDLGGLLEAVGEGGFAAGAIVQDVDFAGGFEATAEGGAQAFVVFNYE